MDEGYGKSSLKEKKKKKSKFRPPPKILYSQTNGNYRYLKVDAADCSPVTEKLSHFGWLEGNGNPLQHSCLENSMDWGAWWATVHGVAKSRTQLHFHFHFMVTSNLDRGFMFTQDSPLIQVWALTIPQVFLCVQFNSVTQSCPTLGNPKNRSTPGLPVHHQLPEFTETHVHWVSDAIQPSHPLSSPSPPAPNPSQHQSLFQWINSSHEVAKVLEFQL